jgi:hypothetical protein
LAHGFGLKERQDIIVGHVVEEAAYLKAARKQRKQASWQQHMAFEVMPLVTYFLPLGPTS